MPHRLGSLLLGFALCYTTTLVSAQEMDPYSRYGLGTLESGDFAASRSMGGLAGGYRNPLEPNYSNPASYSAVNLVTFEGGFNFQTSTLDYNNSSAQTGDGFIDYYSITMPLGQPIRRKGGLSFGLVPYSSMNYSFADSQSTPSVGSYNRLFNGSGRLYEVYMGGGVQVLGSDTSRQALSLGVNANILFGDMTYTESISFPDSTYSLETQKVIDDHVTEFICDVGFQYTVRFNRHDSLFYSHHASDLKMTIGGYARLPTNRASLVDETFDRYDSLTSSVVDTLSYSSSMHIKQNIPRTYGGGIVLNKGFQWSVGANVNYTLWKNFVDLDVNEPVTYRNDLRVSLGMEFRPNVEGNSFLKRIFYRLGGYYDGGYISVNGQNINEYGVTWGFGIPMKSENKGGIISVPYLNLYFSAGSRGTTAADLVQQKFFSGTISFTLNSKWFIKPQYE